MGKKPNYCRGIIIVHGKSERLLAEHIRSNLHLPIEIYENHKSSIQINDLSNVLNNNIFKNKTSFNRNYIVEVENKTFKNFFIMPIMDLDDTTKDKIEQYKTGKMFKSHWLSQYIIPIWNNKNLDHVLYDLGLISKVPNDKEKGMMYREVFPTHTGELDIEQINKLHEKFKSSRKTNMDIFTGKCLELIDR